MRSQYTVIQKIAIDALRKYMPLFGNRSLVAQKARSLAVAQNYGGPDLLKGKWTPMRPWEENPRLAELRKKFNKNPQSEYFKGVFKEDAVRKMRESDIVNIHKSKGIVEGAGIGAPGAMPGMNSRNYMKRYSNAAHKMRGMIGGELPVMYERKRDHLSDLINKPDKMFKIITDSRANGLPYDIYDTMKKTTFPERGVLGVGRKHIKHLPNFGGVERTIS